MAMLRFSSMINDLCKSLEYSHTPFGALIPDREEWEQGRPATTDAICFYTYGSKLEGQVGGGVYFEQLDISHLGSRTTAASSKRRFTL